jgi:AbiV family abortive infection protein
MSQVSALHLLKGAVYAMEQCGILLRDANVLYRNGSYANAIVLAVLAHEELGHWQILLDLRAKVLVGEAVTLEQVQAQEKHEPKQKAGVRSLSFSADRDTTLARLFAIRMTAERGSPEREAAVAQIKNISRRKLGRLPEDRHKLRMSALYVDAVSVDEWNRPSTKVSEQQAFELIRGAVNDYAMPYHQQYSDLQFIEQDDPAWFRALQEWPDRPKLPVPEWPPFPGTATRPDATGPRRALADSWRRGRGSL